MNRLRRPCSFAFALLLAAGPPSETIAASYVFRQPTSAGTYPIPTITNNVVTSAGYYKLDGKTYTISWQGSGGATPYAMSLVAGSLPPGCPTPEVNGTILAMNCVFTAEGNYGGIVAQLSDANGMVVRDNAPTISVSAPPPTLGSYNFPFSGYVGKAYAGSARVTGGRPPYLASRATGTLPPGLALSMGTDANGNPTVFLSGNPTTTGSFTFDVLVTDANQKSVTSSKINVSVSYGPVSLTLLPSKTARTFKGVVGNPIKGAGTAVSGGTPPTVLTLQTGTLPSGLRLAQDGSITGTPTVPGTTSGLQIKAVDAASPTPTTATTPTFSIVVGDPVEVVVVDGNGTSTVGRRIAPLSTTVSGGTAPYAYALAGTPPPGLTFSTSQGTISGVPTQAGRYDGLAVTATDAEGNQGTSRPFAMSVADPVAISGSAGRGTAGTPYSAVFSATGGVPPYAYSVSAGSLPPGLGLSGNGTIAGTPSGSGVFGDIAIRATDTAGGSADTPPFQIAIDAPLTIASTPGGSATRGVPYDARIVAAGGNPPYSFAIVSGTPAPGISMDANGRFAGTPTTAGDFGPVHVKVADSGGGTATTDVSIPVADPLSISGSLPPATVGQAYATGFQASGGSTPYVYELAGGVLPEGLTLDGSSGAIAGTPSSAGSRTGIAVRARDKAGRTATSPEAVLAVSGALRIAGSAPSAATVGQTYAGGFSAMGGRPPYAFSLAAGSLPSGLALGGSSGSLAGTPVGAGVATGLRVQVVDADARTALSDQFAIAVSDVLQVAGSPSPTATVGQSYAATFAARGGRAPFAWTIGAGTLPPGLTLTADGRIAGTPTTPGTANSIQIAATDADGRRASSSAFAITVSSSLSISGEPGPTATIGTSYSTSFLADGGYGTKTFSLAAGTLPAGLALSADGVLGGTPTEARTATGLIVRATDAAGAVADTAAFAIDVRTAVAVAGLPAGAGSVGRTYESGAAATGGRTPYSWMLAAGSLPSGLTLAADTGSVSGIPTTPGTSSGLRLQATDADGRKAVSSSFDIAVASTLTVSGSPGSAATVGDAYSATFAAGGGYGGRTFAIATGTLPAGLTLSSGGLLSGRPTSPGTATGLVVRASDASGTTADGAPFSIDVRPAIALSGGLAATGAVGDRYSSSLTAVGGRPPYAWSLASGGLPPGLELDGGTGTVSGTPGSPGTATGIRLGVVDADGRSATSSPFDIAVASTLAIAGSPSSAATVGSTYSAAFSASGGYGGKTFSMASGTLPAGLTLSAAGVLSGTPTMAGVTTGLVVRATDASGTTASSTSFPIDVRADLALAGPPSGTGAVGAAYSSSVAASGGRPPYTWTLASGTLPPGLSLDAAGGVVSGTPTTPGTATGIRLKVDDADGRSATSPAFDIAIASTLVVAGSPGSAATVGAPYYAAFTASGGYGAKAFAATSGTLPAGLTLSTAGVLSGTPTAAGVATGLVVSATDASGTTASSASFPIDVRTDLALAGSPSGTGAVGAAYSSSVAASGGRSPYAWTLAAGTLPPGLSIDAASGIVSGTPTTPGTATGIRLKVGDADGRSATSSAFDIAIASTLAIAGSPGSAATVGSTYSATFSASGGYGGKTFSMASGTLPAGLTLSAAGVLSGTPTVAGSATGLVVRATDASGTSSSSASFPIDVRTDLALAGSPTGTGAVGTAYSLSVAASGGRSPYAWTLAAGTLPGGLSLDPASGVVSGTPTTPGTAAGIRLKVGDADGRSATSPPFDIAISSTLAVAGSPASAATVGATYSATFTASGGFGTKTFALAAGTLPAGLTLSTAGVLSGTPAAAGTATGLVVSATDASGTTTSSASFSIDVRTGLALAGSLTATASVGVNYSASVAATGGRTPYVWSTASGTLPAGLSLDTGSGVVSGTPTTPGTATGIRLKVADADGRTAASPAFDIAVASTLSIAVPGLEARVGSAFAGRFQSRGGYGVPTFSIAAGAMPPGLTLSTAGVVSGTPTASGTSNGLVVRVTDASGTTSDVQWNLTIRPALVVAGGLTGQATVGVSYSSSLSAAGGRPPYAWSVAAGAVPAGLSLDTVAGTVSGTPSAVGSATGIRLGIVDADGFRSADGPPSTIDVRAPVSLSGSLIGTGAVGSAYSSSLTAGGGRPPYVWSLGAVQLPPGLALDPATGVVSGTPTTPGDYAGIQPKATDADGRSATAPAISLGIASTLTIVGSPASTATVGVPYSATFTAIGGYGAKKFVWNADSLPLGLTFSDDGVLSGTPKAANLERGLNAYVQDAVGARAFSAPFSIDIRAPLALTGALASTGGAGKAYSSSITGTGGRQPYTWSLAAGTLPAGLSLDAASGIVSGTPTTPRTATGIRLAVADADGRVATSSPTDIAIASTLAIAGSPASTATVGVPYSATFTASGGYGAKRFDWNADSLPPGLTLSADGVLSGTPTAAALERGLGVTVQDAGGSQAFSATFSIDIRAPVALTMSQAVAGYVGTAYSSSATASGGRPPYAWTLAAGTLPAGLALDPSTGIVSGTPTTTGGSSGLQLKVVDADARAATSAPFDIPVVSPVSVSGSPKGAVAIGVPYDAQFSAAGGVGSYTYSLGSGTLPDGLVLAPGTGAISGKATRSGTASGLSIRAVDRNGYAAASATFSIVVPDPLTAQLAPPPATVGVSYSTAVVVTGGLAPYVISKLGADLPKGLTIDTSTGSIAGSPGASGDYGGIYYKITDSLGSNFVTASATVSVRNPVVPTAPSFRTRAGVAYSSKGTATGGKTPYTFALTGDLPPGLGFDASTGTFSGTPTAVGMVSGLVLKITDSAGRSGTASTYFDTVAAMAVSSNVPRATAVLNKPYSFSLSTTGGRTPLVWYVNAGSLPTGLTIDRSTGVISGTPTASGTWSNIDIRVRDDDSYVAGAPLFDLYVAAELTVANPGTFAGTVGKAASLSLSASGGVGTYAFSLVAGTLPGGLTLSSGGTISGTPTVRGTFSGLQVQVKDARSSTASTGTFSIVIQ